MIEYVYKIAWKSIMHGKWGKKGKKNPVLTVVRKSTQIINDQWSHAFTLKNLDIFAIFPVLQVMLSQKLEPIQQNWVHFQI